MKAFFKTCFYIIILVIILYKYNSISKELHKLKKIIEYHLFVKPSIKNDDKMLELISLDDDKVQDLYQILKDVSEVLEIAGISYALHDGSLLGAKRHNGFIKWDDDIDITILHKDEIKLSKLEKIFDELGYYFNLNTLYKISKKSNKLMDKNFNYSYPFLDIMIMYHNKEDNTIRYVSPELKAWFPTEFYLYDKYFPLKKCKFGPIDTYCTNDPDWFLEHVYGKNWKTDGVVFKKHLVSKYHQKFNIKIEGKFKEPALPKLPLEDRVYKLKDKILEVIK